MVFGLSSLKRKFFSIEESKEFTNNVVKSNGSPTKRVRVEELTHDGQPVNNVPGTSAFTEEEEEEELEVCFEIIPRNDKGKEKERIEELEEEVREAREITARLAQETREYIGSIDRTMNCVVCFDFIRNPQVMSECGHTACYGCLRSWFTRATTRPNAAPMVSTDEESEGNAEDAKPQPGPSNPTPPPPPGRHRFHSAINRKKTCPECQVVVTHRPLPLYRLRHVGDAMSGSECPVPSFLQPRRKPHRLSKRKDLWHGIFHPPSEPNIAKYHLVVENPGPVQDEGPDPILEHWAQAQAQRDTQLERARWQAAIDEAREEGRRQVIWEQQRERERLEEQRRRQSFHNPAHLRFWHTPLEEEGGQRRTVPPFRGFRRVAGNPPLPQEEDAAPIRPDLASTPVLPPVVQPTLLPALTPPSRIPSPVQPPEFVQGSSTPAQLPTPPVFSGPPPSEAGPSHSTQADIHTETIATISRSQPSSSSSAPVEHRTPSTSHSPAHDPTVLEAIRELRQKYNNPPHEIEEADAGVLDDEGTDLLLFQAMFRNPTPPPQLPATEEERLYPVYAEELDFEDQPDERPLPIIIFENNDPALPDDDDEEEEEDEDPVERLERLVREGEAED